MKKLLKKRLNQKGLTLIELLAVIVILAIIAAIAIPAIGSIIQKQREKAVLSDAQTIIAAAKLAYADAACGTDTTCDGKELENYLDDSKMFEGTTNTVTKDGSTWTIVWVTGATVNPKVTKFEKFEADDLYVTGKGLTESQIIGFLE